MKVVAYIRVSTDEQANSGQSLDAQRHKLLAYASLYELEIVEICIDAGVSAKSLKREGISEALGLIGAGEADGLLIAKLDRLTRSVADWQRLIDEFFSDKKGKQLFSVGDSIDTRTAAGRLVLNVLLSVAQWEREAIAERTTDALQNKIRKGERCGKIRYGFDLASDGRTLVPNVEEQAGIERMRRLRREGLSFRKIALELDRHHFRPKEGGRWGFTSVRSILARAEQ